MNPIPLIDSRATVWRDNPHGRLAIIGHRVSSLATRIGAPIADRLVHIEPLPSWTNAHLVAYMVALWAFAIGINWWGDSMAYMIGSLSLLALWGGAIFWRIESAR